ncbi:glycoside hydrolase family 18 protein [Hypoxylon sp. FL1857]|nr:glycoside hydrolase family 18 protein [Hypoxylon sp. FL1857]
MASSSARATPRIIVYYQTTHDPNGNLISILPLITQPDISLTHLIVAAIHINEDPNGLTLNDHAPSDPRYTTMWAEMRIAQASGIKVLGMLGGAAKGSYMRLDQDQATFEEYYGPLYDLIKERDLNGLDLDVEEEMSLGGIVRLIDRLRADFGPDFIITLAPVAAALLDPYSNLSGFDYEALEVMRGKQIAWYNAQFYCGWGDASNPAMYEMCIARGWAPEKVVVGLLTTPENGPGFIPFEFLGPTLALLRRQFPSFGGVMGWEYFNGLPGGKERPWEWARHMTKLLKHGKDERTQAATLGEIDPDVGNGPSVDITQSFEYYSDGLGEDAY